MEPLRILLIEDSPEDALLISAVLQRSGIVAEYKRVQTADDYVLKENLAQGHRIAPFPCLKGAK